MTHWPSRGRRLFSIPRGRGAARTGRSSARRGGSNRAQAIVEFALAFPLFAVIVFAVMQFGLILVWYFSQTQLTREAARWLAVNPNATDTQVASWIEGNLLPGQIGGAPKLLVAGSTTVSTTYQIGFVRATFTPCLPNPSPATGCGHPQRAPTQTLMVETTYDASHIVFFPASLRIGEFSAGVPTSLPPYRVWIMAE